MSPKGDQAYEVLVQRFGDRRIGPKELHVLRSDGTSRRYIGGKKQTVSRVKWIPSGDAISFVAKRGETSQRSTRSRLMGARPSAASHARVSGLRLAPRRGAGRLPGQRRHGRRPEEAPRQGL